MINHHQISRKTTDGGQCDWWSSVSAGFVFVQLEAMPALQKIEVFTIYSQKRNCTAPTNPKNDNPIR